MQNQRVCSGPASRLSSPAPALGVEAVAFAVAPDALLQAKRQAVVALAGELGTPGPLSCRRRGAQGQPQLAGGDTTTTTPPSPGSYLLQEGLLLCQS